MADFSKFSEIDAEEKVLDGLIKQMENPQWSCLLCKHLNKDGISCVAFPDVIPQKLISGVVRHVRAIGGEKKRRGKPILFEPKEGV